MPTLSRAIDLFLGEYKPSTQKAYRHVLRAMQDYIGPAKPVDKITTEHLLEYAQVLRDNPAIKSPATYNKHVKSIRTFFNWCIRVRFIETSPAIAIKRKRKDRHISRDKAMPDHLYGRLLEYAQFDERYHALVLFLGDTGCRVGGAARLRWPEIDFSKLSAIVTEKGDKSRPVFFGEECAAALRRWRGAHPMRDGDHVFSRSGARIQADNLGAVFRRICRNAGIGSWGPHSLRHRKGHQLADDKVAPSIAAQALGHENPVTTLEFYYPKDWDRVQEAMKKLAHDGKMRPVNVRKFKG